jgi:hypothetical protein
LSSWLFTTPQGHILLNTGTPKSGPTEGVRAWIDPEGYRRFIAGKRRAFEDEVDIENGVAPGPSK